ncbi:MAG: VCBS repeat-containing protein, partial [Myxococcales bacterium]|nr:VCBS repeat-containing protein [Myxococcales bacterium]
MKWKCMSAALSGLLVAAPGAWAAGFAIWTYDGDKAGDALGRSVARLGDVNGDGVPEVVAGAPLNEGRVQVHNGATGTRIWTRSGPDPFSDSFGWSVAGVGDVDGDGIPDVGATAPSYQAPFDTFARGRAYILSGATGATICQWEAASELTLYGQVIDGVLDTDASGVNDVAVGAPIEGPGGVVHVYSGSSCAEIWTIAGTANSPVGSAVSAAGDIDGDSRDDVLVGSAGNDTVAPDAGAAFVYSKLPLLPFGVPIMSWFGENNGDFFGTSVVGLRRNVAGGPDLDVVIGAPYFDNGALSNSGKAYLYSGGTLVYERYGGADDQNFGSAVANAGDATGDGVRD